MKGGTEMTNEHEVFSFELNETLYFERGQEVLEMIGISLDPDISIQSYNEYISIRGMIELQGEYEKDETSLSEEQSLDFEEYESKRYVEKVADDIDGYTQFSHSFPVEISVPKYRVSDMNRITVHVESFDYELPNTNELRIHSMIHIQGIDHQTNELEKDNEENEVLEDRVLLSDSENDLFQFEVKKEDTDKSEEEIVDELQRTEESTTEIEKENEHEPLEGRLKYKESQTFEEFFQNDSDEDETVKTNIVKKKEETPADTTVTTYNENEDVDEQVEEESSEESEEIKGVNFLAKLFREDDEDVEKEKYSQMRICIVQENDTLDKIAEKYKVPKLQLLKQNRLEDDDLSEGQLLSIPAKNVRK